LYNTLLRQKSMLPSIICRRGNKFQGILQPGFLNKFIGLEIPVCLHPPSIYLLDGIFISFISSISSARGIFLSNRIALTERTSSHNPQKQHLLISILGSFFMVPSFCLTSTILIALLRQSFAHLPHPKHFSGEKLCLPL